MLPKIDLNAYSDCVDRFKGKLTNVWKTGSTRSQSLLEIIHTEVCGPFPTKTICGNSYLVTFIDDFSRYSYVYLIFEKYVVLECFKNFQNEV